MQQRKVHCGKAAKGQRSRPSHTGHESFIKLAICVYAVCCPGKRCLGQSVALLASKAFANQTYRHSKARLSPNSKIRVQQRSAFGCCGLTARSSYCRPSRRCGPVSAGREGSALHTAMCTRLSIGRTPSPRLYVEGKGGRRGRRDRRGGGEEDKGGKGQREGRGAEKGLHAYVKERQ